MREKILRLVPALFIIWMAENNISFAAIAACTNDQADACVLESARATNDAQFTSEFIADGVTILGVTGSFMPYVGYPSAYPHPTGPTDCPAAGDVCDDGTVYIGYHPILHVPLYIPTTDQGTAAWKTSRGIDDIAIDSMIDGRVNSSQIPNSPAFPAFKLCKDLTAGGHGDWYLPSQIEMFYLWIMRDRIKAKINVPYINAGYTYWTSSESVYDPEDGEGYFQYAWRQSENNGQYDGEKDDALDVICMRR